jgi:hypothetical protein
MVALIDQLIMTVLAHKIISEVVVSETMTIEMVMGVKITEIITARNMAVEIRAIMEVIITKEIKNIMKRIVNMDLVDLYLLTTDVVVVRIMEEEDFQNEVVIQIEVEVVIMTEALKETTAVEVIITIGMVV